MTRRGRTVDRVAMMDFIRAHGVHAARKRWRGAHNADIIRTMGRELGVLQATYGWNPDWDALLGTESDHRLAVRFGVAPNTVQKHRVALGISRFSPAVKYLKDAHADGVAAAVAAQHTLPTKLRMAAVACWLNMPERPTTADMARVLGVTREAVRQMVKRMTK